MKKFTAAVTALTLALGSVPVLTASADSDSNYSPSLYFKAYESDNYQILPNGTVYVRLDKDTNAITSVNAGVYIKDDMKQAGHIIVKWKCTSNLITLSGLTDPVTVYGKSPYNEFSASGSIRLSSDAENNSQSVSYALGMNIDPFTVSGTASDDYPLAVFDADINPNIAAGMYTIDFMTEEISNLCDILYKYGDTENVKEFFPSGNNAPSLRINVSDRKLGDINNDGAIDPSDATLALREYTLLSSNMTGELSPEENAAADVDGDGKVSPSDATIILRYYTYVMSNGDKDFITFLNTEM